MELQNKKEKDTSLKECLENFFGVKKRKR